MSPNPRTYKTQGNVVLSHYRDDMEDLRPWEAKVVKEEYMDFIAFGEILFDVFPDKATLGGAPLNVAGHMTKLGLEGRVLSSVGSDELGRRALGEIEEIGLSTEMINVSSEYETGKAIITLNGKNAEYEFNDPSAWDHIPLPTLPSHVGLIYYGTLAQRGESRHTLDSLLFSVSSDHRFFDVNIRKHFYTDEIIENGVKNATILKLNDEEVDIVLDALHIKERGYTGLEKVYQDYSLDLILLTRGKEGTMCYKDKWYRVPCSKVEVADTVGAGDSLSAGFLASYIKTGDLEKSLLVGSHIADYVVTQRGALPPYSEKLMEYLKGVSII